MTEYSVIQRNDIPDVNVHASCRCYQKDSRQTIRRDTFTSGEKGSIRPTTHTILFLLEGSISVSMQDRQKSRTIGKGEFIFLPVGSRLEYEVSEEGSRLSLELDRTIESIPECHTFRFHRNNILPVEQEPDSIYPLQANDRIRYFVGGVLATEQDGLKCSAYARLLVCQLIYLIQVYYPQDEYTRFYSTFLSPDIVFSDFIHENRKKYPTVNELSNAIDMPIQQFTMRFRKVFGEAPGSWMKKRKAEDIYYEISNSQRTLRSIAQEHHFSMQNFIRYCRMNFGLSPGAIREQLNAGHSAPPCRMDNTD